MDSKKESIKLKINALLQKTTENGATEAEAVAALEKATELMKAYYIDASELSDPYLGEQCISELVPRIKSSYDLTLFYGYLSRLFDCMHYFNSQRVVFFGFKDDVKLASFFLVMIEKAALNEAERYKKTASFIESKQHYHGRTLVASFIRGFLFRIIQKLNEMYENRKSSIPTGMSLVLVEKSKKVEQAFNGQNIKLQTKNANHAKVERDAFMSGMASGDKFSITQGVEQHKKESQLSIF